MTKILCSECNLELEEIDSTLVCNKCGFTASIKDKYERRDIIFYDNRDYNIYEMDKRGLMDLKNRLDTDNLSIKMQLEENDETYNDYDPTWKRRAQKARNRKIMQSKMIEGRISILNMEAKEEAKKRSQEFLSKWYQVCKNKLDSDTFNDILDEVR